MPRRTALPAMTHYKRLRPVTQRRWPRTRAIAPSRFSIPSASMIFPNWAMP